jgi:PAS domain S-box-containing protein
MLKKGRGDARLVERVARTAAAISREPTLSSLAPRVVEEMAGFGARTVMLTLLRHDGQGLDLVAHRELPDALVRRLSHIPLDDETLTARAAVRREIHFVDDVSTLGPELRLARDVIEMTHAGAFVCVPLIAFERVVGVLSFTMTERPIASAPRRAFRALADMFAVALSNARRGTKDEGDIGTQLVGAIAHRHELELVLHDREERLRAILDHTFQFIGLLSTDGIVLEANKSALDLVGLRREDAVGRPFWECGWWSPEQQPRLRDSIARAAAGAFIRYETEHVAADGHPIAVDFSLTPVRDDSGEVVLLVPEGRDITERKEWERLRQEWTSIVAHDLRQPINVIGLWTQSLGRMRDATPQLPEALVHLRKSVSQLDRLVGDLLDASRLEAHRLELRRDRLDVGAVCRDLLARMGPETYGARTVSVEISTQPATVELDADRFAQALGNLMSNAHKYGRDGTPIAVRVTPRDDEVEIAVTNDGDGIDPGEMPHLFSRFHRTSSARRSTTPGTGLGLYITRGIVEAHGGRVSVVSEPGAKTTFTLILPTA